MSSVLKVGGKWRAQIRRKGAKSISKTFLTKAEAERWAMENEVTIANGQAPIQDAPLLSKVISGYRDMKEKAGKPIGRYSSQHYQLECLDSYLGKWSVDRLTVDVLVDFATKRKADGAGPYTINMDISKLGTVLRMMAPLMRYRIYDVIGETRPLLRHLDLIGPGEKRTRRPTAEELRKIFEYCDERATKAYFALKDIIYVGIMIGLRRGEFNRITWEDLDEERRMILVRDRKDPKRKIGNNHWIPLLGDSFEVIRRQPRIKPRIFPYCLRTISSYFHKACVEKGIEDLRFHDMRHEAASAMIESGWNPLEVRLVTGHKSTKQLETYVNLKPEDLHGKVIPLTKIKAAG